MSKGNSKMRWFYMKKADSYRLLDLFLNITLVGLSFVITFLVSMGYKVLGSYVPEIKDFPYFIAFLPAFAAGFIHPIINYFACLYHGTPLVDLAKKEMKREAFIAMLLSLFGVCFTLVFFCLFYFKAIPNAEEFHYVLICFPMGLLGMAYLAFTQIKGLWEKKESGKQFAKQLLLIFCAFLPLIIGIATYLPTLLGFTYFGICLLPLPFIIGDSLSMDKKDSEITEKETE